MNLQKYLFIDRDGTLIVEPKDNYQIDSLEKLEFIPKVFCSLKQIVDSSKYKLVIVSNQDGLGTDSYPLENFHTVERKVQQAFNNEGIFFEEVLIDKSFPEENSENRKPKTGLLKRYIEEGFDKENSFVIGDRLSDMQLAQNLNTKGIWLSNNQIPKELEKTIVLTSSSWKEIKNYILTYNRSTEVFRKTKETEISLKLSLDGCGKNEIHSGLPFLDHMLEQLSIHGKVDLSVFCKGDLEVDEHHTVEDIALCLGEAFRKCFHDKKGVQRYGFSLPMDDCCASVLIDFGGRPYFKWKVKLKRKEIGGISSEMFSHFFKSFSDAAKCNLHIKAKGKNHHHKIEAIFKAFAYSIKMAKQKDLNSTSIPSSKGSL
ncbi:MAG: bifunctional histidinol-phosphatase/imidazoleglycerol-phosphate dehydratase HisB [Bacteroidales bacterium]